MRITSGGTIGFKIIAKPYEPIDVSATFLVEEEAVVKSKDAFNVVVNSMNEKINKILEKQLKEKANIAVKVYKEARKRLMNVVDS